MLRYTGPTAWLAAASLAIAAAPAAGQQASREEQLRLALEAVTRAEIAAADAKKQAESAKLAAERADKLAEEARDQLKLALAPPPPGTAPEMPPIRTADAAPPPLPECQIDTPEEGQGYFGQVKKCESAVFARQPTPDSRWDRLRQNRSVRTTVATAASGSAATLTFQHQRIGRIVGDSRQRIVNHSWEFGIRAQLDETDKSRATIGTFGDKFKLSSNIAGFLEYGQHYYPHQDRPRPGVPYTLTGRRKQTTVTDKLAAAYGTKDTGLLARCLATQANDPAKCRDFALLEWIFARAAGKDGQEGGFTNPEAVKLYNEVFWGPEKPEMLPRFGWSVRAEVARPAFTYFPFALTQAPDPFNPGEQKTVIDPALFPADFGSRLTKGEAYVDATLRGQIYYHLSEGSADRLWSRYGFSDGRADRYFGWNRGTTIFASAGYLREHTIDKLYQNVQVCPPAPASQPFVDPLTCTKVNIARPELDDSMVLGAKINQAFDLVRFLPPLMISLDYSYKTASGESGLTVPLLFGIDTKGNFQGGLQYSTEWGGTNPDGSPKKRESLFGILVTTKLDLSGKHSLAE